MATSLRRVKKHHQTIAEYAIVFIFVTLTTFVLTSIFLVGNNQSNDSTFAGALMRLHDEIVSVISAPVP